MFIIIYRLRLYVILCERKMSIAIIWSNKIRQCVYVCLLVVITIYDFFFRTQIILFLFLFRIEKWIVYDRQHSFLYRTDLSNSEYIEFHSVYTYKYMQKAVRTTYCASDGFNSRVNRTLMRHGSLRLDGSKRKEAKILSFLIEIMIGTIKRTLYVKCSN